MVPKSYNPAFLQCRSDGHRWNHERTELVPNTRDQVVRRVLYCTNCTELREDLVNRRSGDVEKRKYTAPVGYYVIGQGRTQRSDFRRIQVTNELKGA
jgi:hypothetical protein